MVKLNRNGDFKVISTVQSMQPELKSSETKSWRTVKCWGELVEAY